MKLLITGTPGVGKTSIALALAKKLKAEYINEKNFALKHKIGFFDIKTNELVIPLKKIEKKLNELIKKKKKLIIEGHTLCETKLKVDFVIVIRVDPEILQERLERKNYLPEKVLDNVFCEGIDYCLKHVKRRYAAKKIIEIKNEKNINTTIVNILRTLKEKTKNKQKEVKL